jgi:hypothetical protein
MVTCWTLLEAFANAPASKMDSILIAPASSRSMDANMVSSATHDETISLGQGWLPLRAESPPARAWISQPCVHSLKSGNAAWFPKTVEGSATCAIQNALLAPAVSAARQRLQA